MDKNNKLIIKNLYKDYTLENSERFETLQAISMNIKNGEFVSIIGPSGCGKSTLFNLISGLEKPTAGDILLDGNSIINKKGFVGYMPQRDYLLPWRTILDNIILGMEIRGINKNEAREIANGYLDVFGLKSFENEYPSVLSGGMKQRAALLRTILLQKNLLLLDEPFGALDEITRMHMQQWLLDIWNRYKHTIMFVTHSVDEAIYLSDRIYVLSPIPATIKFNIEINLPRPRNFSIMTEGSFSNYKKKILAELSY